MWQFFRMISNFAQECYYLKNKVGLVDFTKPCRLVKFQSPILGRFQNLLLPLYFRGNVSLLSDLLAKLKNRKIFTKNDPGWKKLLFWVKTAAILWICSLFPKGRSRVIIVSAWLKYKSSEWVNFYRNRPTCIRQYIRLYLYLVLKHNCVRYVSC